MNNTSSWRALLATALLLGGCEDIVTDPRQIVFPSSDVSYSESVQPLFDLSCTLSGCHDDYTRAGNLQLTSYTQLLQRPGMVRPNDSSGSVLMQIIRGRLPHSSPVDPPLTENQIRGIAIWIQEGASNN